MEGWDDAIVSVNWFSDVCTRCKHLKNGRLRNCRAFKEIPMEIWEGKNNHRKPYKGDNGIRFEPIEK